MGRDSSIIRAIQIFVGCIGAVLLLVVSLIVVLLHPSLFTQGRAGANVDPSRTGTPVLVKSWLPPDTASIPQTEEGNLIRYGYNLVAHTAVYLGPNGNVKAVTNGMNCQNCHLEAGTKYYGNNYSAVASTYPKLRDRSGKIETIEKRVNDCIERSLNGKPLDEGSEEMRAFVAYITWVGHSVPKDSVPAGAGILAPRYLDRPADPGKGKLVYQTYCVRCHGEQGKGAMAGNGIEWKYPPLHGDSSYNTGAGLFRLSRFAGYVKANMPNDIANADRTVLTDEEAWDVAAYINSLPRPSKSFSHDWPDISKKPHDHPFGPYADKFSEQQHKYGPYKAMTKK